MGRVTEHSTTSAQPTPPSFAPDRSVLDLLGQEPIGRIPVLDVEPVVDGGRRPTKSVVGELFTLSATVFREGHDAVNATAVLIDPDGGERHVPMVCTNPGLSHWRTVVHADRDGVWGFRVEGWSDPYGTWVHDGTIKVEAGVDVELMLEEGARVLERAVDEVDHAEEDRAALEEAVDLLRRSGLPTQERLQAGIDPRIQQVMTMAPLRDKVSASPTYTWWVERPLALTGAWYEIFPRSEGAARDPETGLWTTGTFTTAAERLPAIARMGFDVVYLTPVHPIGTTNRKGKNNSLTAEENDPGSPYAIGSPHGGHDSLHPELGDWDDFDAFVARAEDEGLQVALDLALQASPDHPWATEHPEFFTTRADGTIAYAENPPKKYQDIYPLNFDNDPRGLRRAVLKVVELWISRGVKIFRVDNPHTKPLWFWEWLIAKVRRRHPEVVFLAEAFTRPAMMHALGRAGFQQSYSYFTWRNTREEIAEYLHEVTAQTPAFYRPNFFVNTPDILTEYLQFGGPAAFKIRAVLAALSNPLWGMYAGYELYEHVARPGAEEYIDNEKYEYKDRDFAGAEARGESLAPFITRLNRFRREHPALQDLQNLTLHAADNDQILVFSKTRRPGPEGEHADPAAAVDTGADGQPLEAPDTVIVVVTCDPHSVREATAHLDLTALDLRPQDLDAEGRFEVEDLITGARWRWGAENYIRLDPHVEPAHVLRVIRG